MSTPAPDYAALAAKYGGAPAQAAPDYAAMAAKYGGTPTSESSAAGGSWEPAPTFAERHPWLAEAGHLANEAFNPASNFNTDVREGFLKGIPKTIDALTGTGSPGPGAGTVNGSTPTGRESIAEKENAPSDKTQALAEAIPSMALFPVAGEAATDEALSGLPAAVRAAGRVAGSTAGVGAAAASQGQKPGVPMAVNAALGGAGELAEPLAGPIATSAERQYTKFLNPTTRANKFLAQKIVPGFARTVTGAGLGAASLAAARGMGLPLSNADIALGGMGGAALAHSTVGAGGVPVLNPELASQYDVNVPGLLDRGVVVHSPAALQERAAQEMQNAGKALEGGYGQVQGEHETAQRVAQINEQRRVNAINQAARERYNRVNAPVETAYRPGAYEGPVPTLPAPPPTSRTLSGLALPGDVGGANVEVPSPANDISPDLAGLRSSALGGAALPETQQIIASGQPMHAASPTAPIAPPPEIEPGRAPFINYNPNSMALNRLRPTGNVAWTGAEEGMTRPESALTREPVPLGEAFRTTGEPLLPPNFEPSPRAVNPAAAPLTGPRFATSYPDARLQAAARIGAGNASAADLAGLGPNGRTLATPQGEVPVGPPNAELGRTMPAPGNNPVFRPQPPKTVTARAVNVSNAGGVERKALLDSIGKLRNSLNIFGETDPAFAARAAGLDTVERMVKNAPSDVLSPNDARELKQHLDIVPGAKGKYSGIPTGITEGDVWARNKLANKIRNELYKNHPDLARLNQEYTFWRNVHDVISATALRQTGQRPLSGMIPAVLGGLGFEIGGARGGGEGVMMGLLYRAVNSPAWRTTSAVVKNRLANAIAAGDVRNVASMAGKIGAGVTAASRGRNPLPQAKP